MILKLMKPLKTGVFETTKEIQLKGIQKCFIEFSRAGNLLGLFIVKSKTIQIYDSRNIKECVSDIEKGYYIYQFKIDDK